MDPAWPRLDLVWRLYLSRKQAGSGVTGLMNL